MNNKTTILYIKFNEPIYFDEDTIIETLNIRIGRNTDIGKGTIIRANVVINGNVTIGNKCHIGNYVLIREGVSIGNDTKIGAFNSIETNATIGNDVRTQGFCMISEHSKIGNNVFLGPHFNNPADNSIGKIKGDNYKPEPSNIEDDVRIGSCVIITPGHSIGKGAVIGAGSVITKNVGPGELWYGKGAEKQK